MHVRASLARTERERRRRAERARALQALAAERYGCAVAVFLRLHKIKRGRKRVSAIYYQDQRNARGRGIDWMLAFPEWWSLWRRSGHWARRGVRLNQYGLTRRILRKPFSAENSVIQRILRIKQSRAVRGRIRDGLGRNKSGAFKTKLRRAKRM